MSTPPPAGSCGCPECGERFDTVQDLYRHRLTAHPESVGESPPMRRGLSGCGIAVLVVLALVIIGFSVCLASLGNLSH